MNKIYQKATRVEVCIQDTTRSYQGALRLFTSDGLNELLDSKISDRLEEHPYVLELAALFDRRYSSRFWVVQEFWLA